jgi:S-adenosyl methyltransferase
MTGPQEPPGVDPSRPSPARVYDYLLGGKQNFESDRAAAELLKSRAPELVDSAWANRGFHQRAATWMARRGVRQFIDIGSGLPTVGNTHEVVHQVDPQCRVVYADNDPMVREYATALVGDDATVRVILGDLRDPGSILADPALRELIDFSQPAGLLMTAVVHFVADEYDPWRLLARYVDGLAPGSYLALSHLTDDHKPPRAVAEFRRVFDHATEQMHFRSKLDVERLFAGLDLTSPRYPEGGGQLDYAGDWGAEDLALADSDGSRWLYCGVARRP